jgi:VanZ family protein
MPARRGGQNPKLDLERNCENQNRQLESATRCVQGQPIFEPIIREKLHFFVIPERPLAEPTRASSFSNCRTYVSRLLSCLAFSVVLLLVLIADCDIACSVTPLVEYVPGQDKTLHFLLIGGLAVPASQLFGWGHDTIRMRGVVQGVVLMIGLSTVEEFSQIFLPTRTFDLADLACNYLGIVCFGLLSAIAMVPVRKRSVDVG